MDITGTLTKLTSSTYTNINVVSYNEVHWSVNAFYAIIKYVHTYITITLRKID